MPQPPVPRPAATLILTRDAADGVQVYLMQRTHEAAFMGGAYVFPGGAVDPADQGAHWAEFCAGLRDEEASRVLGLERGGLAYWIAAIRECFEECGLLLADEARGETLRLDEPQTACEFAALRRKLNAGETTLDEICRRYGLRLAVDRLAYFSHWITPLGLKRRFDTRFFVAAAPAGQTPSFEPGEMVDHLWIRPLEALERHRRGEIQIAFATAQTLDALAKFPDTASLLIDARKPRAIPALLPRIATGREGRRVLLPTDPAYAEVARLDPEGAGTASCKISPGLVTRLSDTVRRITAPNPGVMTGPGTNTYLLGAGDEIAVIDPGPALEDHVRTLLEHADGRIRWILVTHTHPDHSPAARLLKDASGAELLGMPPPPHENQDQSFAPDRVPAHGERIRAAGCNLRVLHTPGHASNHLCYLLEDERLLFTGDHIMQGSTVVISPPDGDMAAYLASLRLLQSEDIEHFAPGHGFLMGNPQRVVEWLLAHRLARENKVLDALRELGPARLETLLPCVYDDVPERMHPVAARSLLAHLVKLKREGRAVERDGEWRAGLAPDRT